MKPTKTKQEQRTELEQSIHDYLNRGGAVVPVARGVSGRLDLRAPLTPLFTGDSEERTPVNDVVAAIEARKKPAGKPSGYKPRPRKRLVLDEFGEPLRWEWVEE